MGGQALFATREDRLFVTIPSDCDTPYTELVKTLRETTTQGIHPDYTALKEAYLHARGRPFPVGSTDPADLTSEKIKIRISTDRITAYMMIYPSKNKGKKLSEHEIRETLIAYGIDDELVDLKDLRKAILRREYGEPIPVAHGIPPIDGEPYTIEWEAPPTDPEGFLHAIGENAEIPPQIIKIVRPAQLAGKRIKPRPGRPGITVDGTPIEPKPSLDDFILGEGLRLSPNGAMVLSTARGHLWLTGENGHKAEVVPVLELDGKQDLSQIARLDFHPGSVIIHGDVETNQLIRVMCDIEIRGALIGAGIETCGSLIVRDGIINTERHDISVGGLVSAAFFERARINAHTIHIRRYALHSKLYALKKIAGSQSSSVKGGETEAGHEITISILGSQTASPTRIAISNRAAGILREKYRTWYSQFERMTYHDDNPDSMMTALKETLFTLIDATAPKMRFDDSLITAEEIYPGVRIIIGNGVRDPGEHLTRVRFIPERIGDKERVALEKW